MHAELIALVLVSAFLQASWIEVIAASRDRPMAATLGVLVTALVGAALARQTTPPAVAAWPWLAASLALHLAYYAALLLAYRFGDLGRNYAIARGGAPLLLAAIAVTWLDEPVPPMRAFGLAMVGAGLFVFAAGRHLFTRAGAIGLGFALVLAVLIGAGTAIDFVGLRQANTTLGYIAWISVLDGVIVVPAALYMRRKQLRTLPWRELPRQAVAGLAAATSYALLLMALSLGDAVPVAALRETSVVFAGLIGAAFLGEPLGTRRLAAAAIVAAGVVLLRL